MATVREHYDALLAELYAWMLGDFDARLEAQLGWLRAVAGAAGEGRPHAIDLGAGSGADAIALARLGYDVTAVDASPTLVDEARRRAGASVRVVEADLVAFLEDEAPRASLAVCLGDTLTHLDGPASVERMLRAARARVAPGGELVVSYRDLSNELRELDRFFLVRSDDARIMTCFVEYLPERAIVHDIVHTRTERGWQMRKSCYPKLRLPEGQVREWLSGAGFREIERVPCAGGLVGLVAR
jgi:predicted TPR repeat methyltransferase